MRAKGYWSVLWRCGLLAVPLAILGAVYLALDPFMVLRAHTDYYPGPAGVFPNRDWVSSRLLLAKSGAERPDAFIFGNSRSMAFETRDWVSQLERLKGPHAQTAIRAFHFDASLESLYGVWSKVRYLHQQGFPLRHVLLVADADLLRQAVHGDQRALFRKTPDIDGSSALTFQVAFFEAFLSRGFFFKYCHFVWSGQWRPYMAGVIDTRSLAHDAVTNDLSFRPLEEEIARTGEEYYRARANVFDAPIAGAGTPSAPVIGQAQAERLRDIKAVFDEHGTSLRIVVSPLYDRRALAPADRDVLETIFGQHTVLDYSGPNDITTDRHNYYEASHYRIAVARRILQDAYAVQPE